MPMAAKPTDYPPGPMSALGGSGRCGPQGGNPRLTDPERTGSNRKMQRVEFGAACLTEIAKWIDQPAVRHVPKLWDSLVRLLILIDDLSNDLVGAVDNAGCRKDPH